MQLKPIDNIMIKIKWLNGIVYSFFKAVSFLLIPLLTGCLGYEIKDNKVYFKTWDAGFGRRELEVQADINTFEVLKFDNWAKDKQQVFYRGIPIERADPSTFEALTQRYAKDNNSAWYEFKPIHGADGGSFRLLGGGYSTDNHDLYYLRKALGSPSPENYKVIYEKEKGRAEWITDGQFYYYYSEKIPSDDYKNITIYIGSDGIAKDSKWVYYGKRKMNYDYKGNMIVDSIDVASFEVTNYIDVHDKWGCINVFKGRQDCKENAVIMPILGVNPSKDMINSKEVTRFLRSKP